MVGGKPDACLSVLLEVGMRQPAEDKPR